MAINLIALFVTIPLAVFWIWMFNDMFNHQDVLPPNERFIWLFGFIFLGILTAGYYYLTVYKVRNT